MMEITDWLDYNPDTGELIFKKSPLKGRKWNRSHPGKVAGHKNQKGYIGIWFEGRHWKAHRLIALKLIPNPENKPQINHKNGIKDDNRLCNLEWVDGSENVQHAFDSGLNRGHGRDVNPAMKINTDDVVKIKSLYVKGSKDFGARALGKMFGVSHTAILNSLSQN